MAKLSQQFGHYTAIIEVVPPGKAQLYWYNKDNKKLLTAPKPVLEKYSKEIDDLKIKFKNIKNTITIQKHRIETFFLENYHTTYSSWRRDFIDHPLMRTISCNLIWTFKQSSKIYSAIISGDDLVSADGTLLDNLEDNTVVELWHPIICSREEREAWRNYIWTNNINQPFRQAFREFYNEYDENCQVNVAGIFVRQHQFRALLRSRGWSYEFHGSFESDSSPTFKFKNDIICKICIGETSTASSNRGIALAVELTDIQFLRNDRLLSKSHLNQIEYSEIMRDIDLFTSVSGLGLKKDWEQIEETFSDISNSLLTEKISKSNVRTALIFNKILLEKTPLVNAITTLLCRMDISMQQLPIPETVKTRALLLELMLKGSSIEKKVKIEERYVYIDSDDGSYRINLASGLAFDGRENSLLPVDVKSKPIGNEAQFDTLLSRIYSMIKMFTS